MNFFSLFGPTINYQSSTNRRDRERQTQRSIPNDFLSSILSSEIQNILQQPTESSTIPPPTRTSSEQIGTQTTSNPETNQEGVEEVLFVYEPLSGEQNQNHGIPLQEMRNISSLENAEETSEEQICVICHQPIERNQIIRKLNSCNHKFHVHCIDEWLATNNSCPTCRINLSPPSEDQESQQNRRRTSFTIPMYQLRYGREI